MEDSGNFDAVLRRFRGQMEEPTTYGNLVVDQGCRLGKNERDLVFQANNWAEQLHAGQFRGDGAEYIVHPRRVALISATMCESGDLGAVLMISLLHDVIEDCGVSHSELRKRYGPFVADSVRLLSTAPRPNEETPEHRKLRKQGKWKKLPGADPLIVLVHLSDVLDNLIACRFVTPSMSVWGKIPRWMSQALQWHIPLAESQFPLMAREISSEVDFEIQRGVRPTEGGSL